MGETALLDAEQDQHLRALQHANRVRLARAGMKRQIAAGDLPVAEVVLGCPWQAHSMEVGDLLMSQKRWGLARCRRLLVSVSVPENKAVGTLTERQRLALAAALDARARLAGQPARLGGPRAVPGVPAHSSGTIPGPAVASSTM
jgi:hypothetical protein